ncbi:hypothetical protein [Methanocella arvoryzae]|nr:hypothetical protein [Methanocella arvoryzae]
MAAIAKAKDVDRVEVRGVSEDPVRNVVCVNQYAGNPAAKAEKDPKRK